MKNVESIILENDLPVLGYKEEIIKTIEKNNVTIVKADTGAGKTTQVPQILLEAGYEVVVTQPRRIATRTNATRVAEEMEVKLGGLVGYRTAFERYDSNDTKLLFCSDGLQLVRMLAANFKGKKKVLVIDEVHEWNLNIETLIAWVKRSMQEGCEFKVVVMSATLDTASLQEYFGANTPVIDIPGRLFPVEKRKSHLEITDEVRKFVSEGRNVLVFLPGKREIEEAIATLKESEEITAVLLPLHGDLDIIDQKKCFRAYNVPKVIFATNIAQTSITIPDIDAVVDSGKERRIEVENGVEGLFLRDISQADCKQRMGRAGRTKEGVYVLCSDNDIEDRPAFPIPEIKRSILDQVVLRLASVGIDADNLDFYHQPNREEISNAKNTLNNLGALKGDEVTEIGHKMAKMPVSCKYARMILEASKRGVTDDVIAIAAIMEVGSLLNHRDNARYSMHTNERSSDLLAELDIWNKISKMGFVDFRTEGIFGKNYFRIKELIEKLFHSLEGMVEFGSTNDRKEILISCVAGMVDHLYIRNWNGYENGDGQNRQIDRKSCLYGESKLLVGIPKTIEVKGRWGITHTIDLISMATEVNIDWLLELAPELFSFEESMPYYSSYSKCCMITKSIMYRGIKIHDKDVEAVDHPDAKRLKEEWEEKEKRHNECYNSLFASIPKRQETIEVDGYIFNVNGQREPVIHISSEILFQLKTQVIKLDNKKTVTILSMGHSSNNVSDLKEKIKRNRIKVYTEEVKDSLPKESSAKISVVTNWFEMVGKVEILAKDHINTDPVYGFVHLELVDKKIKLNLSTNEEESKLLTDEALRFLFGKEISQNYSDKKFLSKKDNKKVLTKKGEEAKRLFFEFVRAATQALSISSFENNLKELDEIFNELILTV